MSAPPFTSCPALNRTFKCAQPPSWVVWQFQCRPSTIGLYAVWLKSEKRITCSPAFQGLNTHELGSLKSQLRRILTGAAVRRGQAAVAEAAERAWPQVWGSEREAGLRHRKAAWCWPRPLTAPDCQRPGLAAVIDKTSTAVAMGPVELRSTVAVWTESELIVSKGKHLLSSKNKQTNDL